MFRIGFASEETPARTTTVTAPEKPQTAARRSVVQVLFPEKNRSLAYYNDCFDLHPGDMVYVEGSMAGQRGRVTEVNYNFKIRLTDYKRVIAVADTEVHGEFHGAGAYFVSFDRAALPPEKLRTWFMAPEEREDLVTGSDGSTFWLDGMKDFSVSPEIAERGHGYYMDNRVRYLCLDGTHGYALVEGGEPYEVEFEYVDGKIGGLVCSCYCSGNCKHMFAAMLQMQEMLDRIEVLYRREYETKEYFAAVLKGVLFTFAVDGRENGSFTL